MSFFCSEIKKLGIWIQFSHVERSLPGTANKDVNLNEPCSTLVSTLFMSLTYDILNLPIAGEKSFVVIRQYI